MRIDLRTGYLGLNLAHPIVAGAGPLADSVDGARRLEDAGAAAIVMRSLFEEQLDSEMLATHDATAAHAESHGEALNYFADPHDFVLGPDEYLDRIRRIKDAVDVPLVASLNGHTRRGWLDHASWIAQAGADALEINLYYVPTDTSETARSIESLAIEVVTELHRLVQLPLAVKLSPFHTALPSFAARLEEAGASALVLFNRFYDTDIDVELLEYRSQLDLSDPRELPLRLRWLAILAPQLRHATLAASGGVHTELEVVKAIMAGASAVQMVSALLQRGSEHLRAVRERLGIWMAEHGYESIEAMRGCMNRDRCPDPTVLARANYVHLLQTWRPR